MEHGDAIRELQDKERQLVRKDALILKLKDRDLRRREERRQLQEELRRARNNIGELNSMIVRLESTLESVRRAHENQAKTIAEQGNTIHALNLEKASLEGLNNDLVGESRELRRKQELAEGAVDVQKATLRRELMKARQQVEEWREAHQVALRQACGLQDQVDELLGRVEELEAIENQWPEDDAPNLALTACKKKLEQLEGMLENQRRSTRELGVNLQRVRDEKAALQVDVIQLRGQVSKQESKLAGAGEDLRAMTHDRDMWKRRAEIAEPTSRIHENNVAEYYQKVQKLEKELKDERDRTLRALTLMRRGVNILDPVKGVTGIESTYTPPMPEWEAAILRTPAKKAEPMHRCGGLQDSHSCIRTYTPGGPVHHPDEHLCHCGWRWPW